ncbi:MAG: acyl-CoA dehydrogenase family protein [Desulfomonilia bacterium]
MNRNIDDLFIFPKQWMDDESRSIATLVRQWADKEIISKRMEYRENYARLFKEKREKLGLAIGLQRLTLPVEHGGFGWNSPENAPGVLTILCETGRADAAIGITLAAKYAIFATITLEHNINKKLCDTLAPLYAGDKIKTVAIILPGAGIAGKEHPLFNGRAILAEAKAVEGGYTIEGANLRPLFSGKEADLFCVVCAGKEGKPCIAFVPGDAAGVKRGMAFLTTGLNACENADVTFSNVRVSKENVIKRDGAVEELYVWLNLLLGGVSAGAGTNFYEMLFDWSETRVIKGGTMLKENPLCASVLADVAEEVALSKLLLYDLAQIITRPEEWSTGNGACVFTFAEMIGSHVQQSVMKAINRGLELMGSAGYSKEWHVEKHWRDVKTIQSLLCGVAAEAPVKMDTARFFYNCTEI